MHGMGWYYALGMERGRVVITTRAYFCLWVRVATHGHGHSLEPKVEQRSLWF